MDLSVNPQLDKLRSGSHLTQSNLPLTSPKVCMFVKREKETWETTTCGIKGLKEIFFLNS